MIFGTMTPETPLSMRIAFQESALLLLLDAPTWIQYWVEARIGPDCVRTAAALVCRAVVPRSFFTGAGVCLWAGSATVRLSAFGAVWVSVDSP